MQPVNGRRISTAPRLKRDYYSRQPENAEIINYVYDSWNEVSRGFRSKSAFATNSPNVTYYQASGSNNRLANFEPFDLESWWGKKMVQNCSQNRSP